MPAGPPIPSPPLSTRSRAAFPRSAAPSRPACPAALATYLARMSHSRLTRAPGRYPASVVLRQVCGMMAAERTPPSSAAMVRLMPSMAMEPFSTRKGSSSAGTRTRSHQFSSPSGSEREELARAVHVALHDVAAQTAGGRKRALQVHARARAQVAQVAAAQGFGRHVGGERIGPRIHRREAHAVHRDAGAHRHVSRSPSAAHPQARAGRARRQAIPPLPAPQ